MSGEEPGPEVAPEPREGTGPNSTFGRKDVKKQSRPNSIDNHSTHSQSTSVDTTDDEHDEGPVKHGFPQKSCAKSSEPASHKQDESGDEDAMSSSSISEDEDLATWLQEQPKKVNVKWCDYEAFKNRFSPEEGHDIIEVLEGHPDQLRTEIMQERSRRRHKKHSTSRNKRRSENDTKFIHRVRIQSPAILYVLGRLTGKDDWDDEPLVFLRPFQTFYYSFPFAKYVANILEQRLDEEQSHDGEVPIHNSPLPRSEGVSSIEIQDPLQKLSMPSNMDIEDIIYGLLDFKSGPENSLAALEHMRLYIDFVEKHIVPMWDEARGSSKHKVRFSDLPMYFRPGDILYEPLKSGENKNKTGKAGSDAAGSQGLAVHQNYWKLCWAQFQETSPDPGDKAKKSHIGRRMLDHNFKVHSFHIDFDGDDYGPAPGESIIGLYEGEMDIKSLTLYPLRFDPDADQKTKELTVRAKNFRSYVRERHLSYDGWTLIHTTYARRFSENQRRKRVEHIEGEIMIDFKEGFQSDSGFVKPYFGIPEEPKSSSVASVDPLLSIDQLDMDTRWWSDTTRSKKKLAREDVFLVREPFCGLQSSHVQKEEKVLKAYEDDKEIFEFDPEHLLLFPQRLIAYSFRARKFFVANIDFISVITAPKSPFRDLKIESEHKRILKSLVGRHFQKQDIRRQNKDATLDQDFIRGKGSGLVILLHGVPGVGKTTTAEAVALDNRKPLFALTSGDLGSTSRDVETALRETFRLAAMWDCVLLLDEADLFLAKRDVGDLVRNSLVSVFLRVLDYYDGVLFLTTNRVGTVDEAFRSRIHLSLYYPALRKKQALEIFKLNIRRIKEIEKSKAELRGKGEVGETKLPPTEIDEDSILNFATRQWEITRDNPSRRWNGRQIRNSFQIAYSLVNLDQVSIPTSNYDDDYDDDDVDYDDEPEVNVTHPDSKDPGIYSISPTVSFQVQKPGKLDSSQFEIVARSIQRFDSYLDKTRGQDSDYAKIKNLRRDDYLDSDDEGRSPGGTGRYSGGRVPRSPHRGTNYRSPVSPAHLAPPPDRGGRMQRNSAREREQRSYGSRRGPEPDVYDDDYAEEMLRSRAGGPPGSSPRSRHREYDDDYEDSHHRYR
ncbi:uncharacterized protein LA080_007649 [Diaporthe eres]|nr:uncharacterized protein LA080_007649 [Diaporthe eres]